MVFVAIVEDFVIFAASVLSSLFTVIVKDVLVLLVVVVDDAAVVDLIVFDDVVGVFSGAVSAQ